MKKGKFKWWQLLLGLVVVIMVVNLVIGLFVRKEKTAKVEKVYTVVTVKEAPPLTYSGKVEAVRTQILVPTTGKAQSVTVQNGDQVAQGQAVMTTYSQSYEEQATEARQALEKAKRQVAQQERALTQAQNQARNITNEDPSYAEVQNQVTTAQNQVADARAEVSDAQTKLNDLNSRVNGSVLAPFAGNATVEYDKTGQPSVSLSSNELQLTTQISEYDYAKIKVGQAVDAKALATKKQQSTQVNYLAKVPDQASKANDAKYTLTAPLDPGQFMAGQTLTLSFPQTGLAVPITSVKNGAVYVVEDGKARKVNVSGTDSNGSFIVNNGLRKGQKVIAEPDQALKDGKRVKTND